MTGGRHNPPTIVLGADFLRFAAVGGIGFIVDAGVLLALISLGWAGPIQGRVLSFACALLVTFELNRSWSFNGGAPLSRLKTFAAYVSVQGVGFMCNLVLYSAAYLALPSPLNRPIVCLALASGFALVVNFVGSRFFVFRRGEAALTHPGVPKEL